MLRSHSRFFYPSEQGCRSRPFWLEPEPFFLVCSDSYSDSTVNILFLRDLKYDYDDYDYDYDDYDNDYNYDDYDCDYDYDYDYDYG